MPGTEGYPSVTEVFEKYISFAGIKPEILAFAQARGTAVHSACFTYARGLPIFPPISPENQLYVDSFARWFDANVDEVVLIEPEWVDLALRYMGHPDIIVKLRSPDVLGLVDLKTPTTYQPIWKAQLAAYWRLGKVHDVVCPVVGSLQLDSGGKLPKFTHEKEPDKHFSWFFHALMAHHYFTLMDII